MIYAVLKEITISLIGETSCPLKRELKSQRQRGSGWQERALANECHKYKMTRLFRRIRLQCRGFV